MPPKKQQEAKASSDPRFAALGTDPRFVRPKRQTNKVALDDRFKGLLDQDASGAGPSTDKYGRKVDADAGTKELKKFYRMDEPKAAATNAEEALAYARGELMMESSDEEAEEGKAQAEAESDEEGSVELGPSAKGRQYVQADSEGEDYEIDLDEDADAALPSEAEEDEIEATKRLAAVNLDWDHVRAIDLFKVFASVLSTTAPEASALPPSAFSAEESSSRRVATRIAKGRVNKVSIYPSEFGKTRLAREELEGPPKEIFAEADDEDLEVEEVDETNILQPDEGEEFNQKALRRYQLERLRYYYAVVEFNTISAARHAFSEIQGTEFERSANMFELRFVPDDMEFDEEPKDSADGDQADYQANEYVTDALRNSKVKLTWDADDPQRSRLTRLDTTKMSKKDVDQLDFAVYLASSSGSEDEEDEVQREKMRKLFGLDGKKSSGKANGDMEITFAPALNEKAEESEGEENTIEKYKRKEKERKMRKKAAKAAEDEEEPNEKEEAGFDDTFFEEDANMMAAFEAHGEGASSDAAEVSAPSKKSKKAAKAEKDALRADEERKKAELELLVDDDSAGEGPGKHFDMTDIMRAEKDERSGKKSRSARRKMAKAAAKNGPVQDAFAIDVKDDRFSNLHQDHQFALDPSNPRYRKTKNMDLLLQETRKRRDNGSDQPQEPVKSASATKQEGDADIASLVASVKRKSNDQTAGKSGKRRK